MGARLRWLPFELHPETPPGGAPKPFSPREWPEIRARLLRFAGMVGLPMDPPQRNLNSRLALETGELVRERGGDAAAGRFHHAASRAYFAEGRDISDPAVVAELAAPFGIAPGDVEEAWRERRYREAVDAAFQAGIDAGVTGVPAFGWPGGRAVAGMQEPEQLVAVLEQLHGH
ncbi:hypothetical protein EPN52_12370 [bacterium]|nr:MAG: hypothetical protein EPN52_12370 [bacterium]